MEFYLENTRIDNVQNGVVVNETQDETFDTCSLVLTSNSIAKPIKPYSRFKIVDGNETLYFVVASDAVTIASKSPLRYSHNLSLIEETAVLQNYLFRNTICKQPSRKKKFKLLNECSEPQVSVTYALKDYEKVKAIYLDIRSYYYGNTGQGAKPAVGNTPSYAYVKNADAKGSISVLGDSKVIFNETRTFKAFERVTLPLANYKDISISLKVDKLATPLKVEDKVWSSSINVKVVVETYYYSILDVINLIKERAEENYGTIFTLGRDLAFLNEIVAPDFGFTETNVLDALREVFTYIDATPRLENGVLTIEYFNEPTTRMVDTKIVSENVNLNKDKYANSLVSKFDNAGFEEALFYPSEDYYTKPKPTTIGVPTENDWAIVVDNKIRYVEGLECKVNETFAFSNNQLNTDLYVDCKELYFDLSDYIEEDTNFLQLPMIRETNFNQLLTQKLQNNTLHYKSGSNEIYYKNVGKTIIGTTINGLGFTLVKALKNDIFSLKLFEEILNYSWNGISLNDKNALFKVEYYPYVNGKMEIETEVDKFNGSFRLSQANGATSINRMGNNLYGQLLRMGNAEITLIPPTSTFKERYKKGDIYKNDWIVNKASTTIFKDFCSQTLQCTKNFNKISQFIRLDQKKRFNEIDTSVVAKSESIIKNYVYFDTKEITEITEKANIAPLVVREGFIATFNGSDYKNPIDLCVFSNEQLNGKHYKMPFIKYGCGNALCFECSFENAVSAGEILNTDSTKFGEKYFTNYALYTDENGRYTTSYVTMGYLYDKTTVERVENRSFDKLPIAYVENAQNNVSVSDIIKIVQKTNKQPNEIFAMNYELICLSKNKNLFINNNFIIKNKLVNNASYMLYFYESEEKYNIMDTKVKGFKGNRVNAVWDSATKSIILGKANIFCQSWAIGDDKGNLFISCNEPKKADENIILCFSLSGKRL